MGESEWRVKKRWHEEMLESKNEEAQSRAGARAELEHGRCGGVDAAAVFVCLSSQQRVHPGSNSAASRWWPALFIIVACAGLIQKLHLAINCASAHIRAVCIEQHAAKSRTFGAGDRNVTASTIRRCGRNSNSAGQRLRELNHMPRLQNQYAQIAYSEGRTYR